MNKVQVWEEKVIIPTYEAGKPDKNPMFLEKRLSESNDVAGAGRQDPESL